MKAQRGNKYVCFVFKFSQTIVLLLREAGEEKQVMNIFEEFHLSRNKAGAQPHHQSVKIKGARTPKSQKAAPDVCVS